jgi:hypothetical protein
MKWPLGNCTDRFCRRLTINEGAVAERDGVVFR